ncbi:undecaprenyl-diphosphate phosphatase [Trebonia kvetii]|uniref:undecaprenyl-diphosphate phosphatase n=1 Tax=Trebonia kvetii TaxID=2480626 RepID=UPI001651EE27|nr:undecaprenyl-diphosphate phosphatase [Trebonia kvetii]
MTYLQAVVIALIQGVTELFPISSLGHSVLVPAWFGGSWESLVTQSSEANSESSFYLAYIVALHCATALALLWFFRADWVRIIRGFLRSLPASVRLSMRARRPRLSVQDKDERLAWMIIFATIPVGLTGILLEHAFRTLFAKPLAAAIFLFINGLILLGAEVLRRSTARRKQAGVPAVATSSVQPHAPAYAADPGYPGAPSHAAGPPHAPAFPHEPADRGAPASHRGPSGGRAAADIAAAERSDERISGLSYKDATVIGAAQILALLAGISRSGVTMAGGLWRGLDNEDAARFAFLLATPVILAAGLLKVPSLAGPAGAHIHGQVAIGFIVCGIAAYASVRFLVRWFQTRTLTPFAIYCLAFGLLSILRFG